MENLDKLQENDFVIIRLKAYNTEYVVYTGIVDYTTDKQVWFTKASTVSVISDKTYHGKGTYIGIEKKDIESVEIL